MTRLILASASPYRRELLARLNIVFEQLDSRIDETARIDERPAELALRLAHAKAAQIASRQTDALIIGCDQVAVCAGHAVGKPGSRAAQIKQLQASSGAELSFYTAVAMRQGEICRTHLDCTTVRFRTLDQASIARYVDAEPAADCAGGFKVEGLGISLFTAIETCDPTALQGLPLIAVSRLLREFGIELP